MYFYAKSHWGTHVWGIMHTLSVLDYDINDPNKDVIAHEVESRINSLKALQYTIPCDTCRELYTNQLHFLDTINAHKPMELFKWSVDTHNSVNKHLGRETFTYEQALAKWCSHKHWSESSE